MLPNPEIREVNLGDYFKILKKRIGIILAFLIIIPTIVTIKVNTAIPMYKSTVSILIEKATPKVTKFEEVYQTPYYSAQEYYQTQYKILASRALSERVFEDMHLSKDPDFSSLKDAVGKVNSMVGVMPVRNSQIVLVSIEDTDALRASSLANAFAKAYIQQDIEIRNRANKEAAGWLESQLDGLKKKMQEAEGAVNKYVQENKIVALPDVEKKTETLLESLKQQKAKIENELAEASKRYKKKHPKMVALMAKLDEANKRIEEETNNILNLNQKLVQYNLLKKEAESTQQLYSSLLSRAKETDVTEKLQVSNIRILDAAKPAEAPFKPQKNKDIMVSILLALFCGIGLSFFLEYLDSSIRTAEDVTLYLSLAFLGYIPSAYKESKVESERNLICFQKPKSTIAESYRTVRTSLLFASPEDRPLKTILITSSLPEEGKTFTTTNLATIFSQLNERIVLIDTDMRRSKVHKVFKVEQKNGLSDFLTGKLSFDMAVRPTFIPNLSLITAGTIPPNPSELLSSAKISSLFEVLKLRFDRIIIDSPPILSVADTSILANIVDGIVLVIKGASTRLEAIRQSKQKIMEAKGRIMGVVVNNIAPEKEDRYYYYHYYYSEEQKKEARKK